MDSGGLGVSPATAGLTLEPARGFSGAGRQNRTSAQMGPHQCQTEGSTHPSCPCLSSLALRAGQTQLVLSESLLAVPIMSLCSMHVDAASEVLLRLPLVAS